MKATRIADKQPCEGHVGEWTKQWRSRHGPATDACPFRAKYLINGKPLCASHAQKAALKYLLSGEVS